MSAMTTPASERIAGVHDRRMPRRTTRLMVAAFAAVLLASMVVLTPSAEAEANKVDICHQEGASGSYHLINVSERASAKHVASHGDGVPGDPVPGLDGFHFGSDCVPADVTPPVVTVPGSLTVDAPSSAGAEVEFTASAYDFVDGPLAPTCVQPSGSTFPIGDTTVTCTATDAAGNTGTTQFAITVNDVTPVHNAMIQISKNGSVIAEWLDTNNDGQPSVGDTHMDFASGVECVIHGIYPNTFGWDVHAVGSSSTGYCRAIIWYPGQNYIFCAGPCLYAGWVDVRVNY